MPRGPIARHAWRDPVTCFRAASAAYPECVFLYSSLKTGYSGRYSWLACDEVKRIEGDDFAGLEQALAISPADWFGWLGYPLRHALEKLSTSPYHSISNPPLRFSCFRYVMRWDHEERIIEEFGERVFPALAEPMPLQPVRITSLSSPMSRQEYLRIVEETLEQIREGNFYQANITRKFRGKWEGEDVAGLFLKLCEASPAPYSAFLRWPDIAVLSSSPELFLRADVGGRILTRPIKGTKGKQEQDGGFLHAEKDRAENLMIVDLMRNDLSRVCVPGSVSVDKLFEADEFSTLSHLSSEISGQLQPGLKPLDTAKACFPPGSMTGAPKIAAMEWCGKQEGYERGIYSGALGWMRGEACELSVVIRTLILQASRYEFQVGGGIVADSDPLKEWQETLTKARGLGTALGIAEEALAAL